MWLNEGILFLESETFMAKTNFLRAVFEIVHAQYVQMYYHMCSMFACTGMCLNVEYQTHSHQVHLITPSCLDARMSKSASFPLPTILVSLTITI